MSPIGKWFGRTTFHGTSFNTSSLVQALLPHIQSVEDEADYKDEIRQAIRQGIDGFAVDVHT